MTWSTHYYLSSFYKWRHWYKNSLNIMSKVAKFLGGWAKFKLKSVWTYSLLVILSIFSLSSIIYCTFCSGVMSYPTPHFPCLDSALHGVSP